MTRELEQVEDIKLLVDTFYNKIREDDLLGPIFVEVIQDRWTRHQNQIYTFWQTELLGEHLYCVNPFMPRADLPVKNNILSVGSNCSTKPWMNILLEK